MIVKSDISQKIEPEITYINEDLLEIAIGAGTGLSLVQFYSIKNDLFSVIFESPLLIENELVAYMSLSDGIIKFVVQNIFDTGIYYNEFLLDFSPVANPKDALIHMDYLDNNRLKITYLSGENYTNKSCIIQL